MGPYQPLSWLSYAIDHELWCLSPGLAAPEAARFHATNVLLHALAAIALFLAARKLFEFAVRGAGERARTVASALAALLFAIHPLRCESVAWLTERRDVLSGLFFTVALAAWLYSKPERRERVESNKAAWLCAAFAAAAVVLFFASVELPDAAPLRWGQLGAVGLFMAIVAWIASALFATRAVSFAGGARWFAISIAAFACALMSKGLTLVLPVLLLVVDAWPLRRLERTSKSVLFVEKLPLFALVPIAAALAFWGQASARSAVVTWESHTLVERAAQACYGLCFYPLRTIWPADLLPLYELPSDVSFADARFALSAVVVIATCIVLFALRRRIPAAVAAWVAFAVTILPVLGFTQAGPQLVADRYSYLACMPFALFAAGAWLAWLRDRERARAAAGGVAFACVAVLGVLTFRQTRTWHDTETMFARVIAVNPASPAGFAQMATYRSYQAQHAPDDDERRRLLLEASEFFRRAFELDPHPFAPLLLNYGTNLLVLGRASEAVDLLRKFVAARPQSAMGATNLGLALGLSSQPAEALQWLQRAVAIDPNYATGWLQLAAAHDRAGDKASAITAYQQVLRLQPNNAQAHSRLTEMQ